ncbi:MAG: hypothetical protein WC637_19775, partial [Victivallales bacterium]
MISKSGFSGKSVRHIPHSLKGGPGIFRSAISFIAMILTIAVGELVHAENVTNEQATLFKHPVLDRWCNSVADGNQIKKFAVPAKELMDLSDAQLLAVIPEQTPLIHHQCPVCARKKPVEILPEQQQPFPGIFDPLKPDQVQCKDCKTAFPNNEFPTKQSEVYQNMLGEDIAVPYWEDTQGSRTLAEKLA